MKSALLIGSALLVSALPSAALAEPVLLISIDGLQPADVLQAEQRGIDVPNLKRFITDGSYANSVRGVLPTITYPSHATLLTGASPSRHGIVGNNSFDPMQINQGPSNDRKRALACQRRGTFHHLEYPADLAHRA